MRYLIYVASISVALLTASCTGSLGVQPGDAVVPPELDDPVIEVVVLAADDLGVLTSTVTADGEIVEVTSEGALLVTWLKTPIEIEVAAEGFHSFAFTVTDYPDTGSIEFRLEPVVLKGRVTTERGRPLPGVEVRLGDAVDQTDNEGRYSLERAREGVVVLERSAWESAEYEWDGSTTRYDMAMTPETIFALRVTPEDLLDRERWISILSLTDMTGVNGLVVDLKGGDGTVFYASGVEKASLIGAVSSYFDIDEIVDTAGEHDLYLIGRVSVFQDVYLATAENAHAVLNADGDLWRSRNGYAWMDPSDPASFEYSIDIAEEACRRGFDEVLFDNVSFPIGGDVSAAVFDGEYNQEVRVSSINAFLTRAYSVLRPLGCTVSSTLLGIVLESSSDEGVGQLPGPMSRIVDVLSPTLYSTNYMSGWNNFDDPDDHAVEIVGAALRGGRTKLDGYAYFRPWLQTWEITKEDQRAVQRAVEMTGSGWMLWSNTANYSVDALPTR